MKANTASRTAQYMALFRALETKRSSNKKLFNDPYAINFLDKNFKTVCNISSLPFAYNIISKIIQRKIPGALSSGVARTKYIDDLLQYTIDNGTRQVITNFISITELLLHKLQKAQESDTTKMP